MDVMVAEAQHDGTVAHRSPRGTCVTVTSRGQGGCYGRADFFQRPPMTPLFALLACTSPDADSGLSESAVDSPIESSVDSDPVGGPNVKYHFKEFYTGTKIKGAEVTYGDVTVTTDDDGYAEFDVAADAVAVFTMSHAEYRPTVFHNYIGGGTYETDSRVPSTNTLSLLGQLMGLTPDESKGILLVQLFGTDPTYEGDAPPVAGATIDVDAAYQVALTYDEEADFGLGPSNTTTEGELSYVIFVNLDPGTITISVDEPEGYACTYGAMSVDVAANSYNSVSLFCPPE